MKSYRVKEESCEVSLVLQVALLYMLSRLVVNVSGTYWPFYVTKTLKLDKVQRFYCHHSVLCLTQCTHCGAIT